MSLFAALVELSAMQQGLAVKAAEPSAFELLCDFVALRSAEPSPFELLCDVVSLYSADQPRDEHGRFAGGGAMDMAHPQIAPHVRRIRQMERQRARHAKGTPEHAQATAAIEAARSQRNAAWQSVRQERAQNPPAPLAMHDGTSHVTVHGDVERATRELNYPHGQRGLIALSGAPAGAAVRLTPGWAPGTVEVHWRSDLGFGDRTIYRDSGGRLVMHNEEIGLNATGTGTGRQIFAAQVSAAQQQGFDRIECLGKRSPSHNGYYTWPRMGYDAPLTAQEKSRLPANLSQAENVSDLMRNKRGRDYWRERGNTKQLEFDCKPGSQSLKMLRGYIAEKNR